MPPTTIDIHIPPASTDADGQSKTADAIFLAAARLFHEKGYAATSMSDLAKAMKMTKAGLYYYIKSKEDLLYQILDRNTRTVAATIVGPASKIEDPEERLRFIISAHCERLLLAERSIVLAFEEAKCLSPKRRREIETRHAEHLSLVKRTLEELRAQGKLRAVSGTVATFSVFAMILAIPHWYPTRSTVPVRDAVNEIMSVLLRGLLVLPAKPNEG